MRISDIRFTHEDGASVFSADVAKAALPHRSFGLWFKFRRKINPPETLGDPFLAAALLPAMFLGEDLEVLAPVSASLARSLSTIQDILLCWHGEHLRRIRVHIPGLAENKPEAPGRGAAVFFSGGVDSWYTLLKNRAAIRGLVTVKGFDVLLEDDTVWPEMIRANEAIAAHCRAGLFAVETNLRIGLDPNWPELGKPFPGNFWAPVSHGACLAAVGLCLQRHFDRILIASGRSYADLRPWGSHPLLDPLWSTAGTRFEHDGCEASRMAKLERIVAESPDALRHLRVCIAYDSKSYNCGECEKCLRTMLALRACGCLEASAAFRRPLSLKLLARRRLEKGRELWYREMLPLAEARADHEMARALRVILGEEWSLDREWHFFKARSQELGAWVWRKSGMPRHARSVRKRLNRLRNLPS